MEWIIGAIVGVIGGFVVGVWQGFSKAKKTFTEEYFAKKRNNELDSNGGKPVGK